VDKYPRVLSYPLWVLQAQESLPYFQFLHADSGAVTLSLNSKERSVITYLGFTEWLKLFSLDLLKTRSLCVAGRYSFRNIDSKM